MQIIKWFLLLPLIFSTTISMGQSTNLFLDAKEYHVLDRMEILNPGFNGQLFSSLKPYSRAQVEYMGRWSDSTSNRHLRSRADFYNRSSLFMNAREGQPATDSFEMVRRPILKSFYNTKANFYEVNHPDFFLVVNPVLHVSAGKQVGYDKNLFLNARGVTIRGRIAKKLGFSSTIIENQERTPTFVQQQIRAMRAVPGVGFYKLFKKDTTAFDFFDGRGYIVYNANRYIDLQFGFDKHFIGNGFRSMLLSDWSNSYLFAKINTRIWKFHYQNIFMELNSPFVKRGDSLLKRKYAAMHFLSFQANRWLNIGVFEGVMFGRPDRFDFQYLNPVIFYRHIEGTIGSPDNALAGLDVKANVAKTVQLYGQLMLDEFILSKFRKNPNFWTNKYGLQLGAKYINVLGIKNLDLQVEVNRVRPFTYSHNDTINNYTHYNQPLAHPLGANFQELLGIIRYQPHPQWRIYGRMQWYEKGLDSNGVNMGGDIFQSYLTRTREDGYELAGGNRLEVAHATLQVSYEWKQNLFLEAMIQHRKQKIQVGNSGENTWFSVGLRWNAANRIFDF
jgi:hypothetical protein